MNRPFRIVIALISLAIFGLVRLPIEQRLTVDLTEKGILAKPLDTTTTEKLGQTGAVVALGGLRSFVASLVSFSVWSEFERQNWREVEEGFGVITTLQPRSRYYWSTGSWHLAFNAAADAKNDQDLRPARREILERRYIDKGRKFLEKGVRINPDNMGLKLDLISLLTHPYKPKDYPEAARLIQEVIDEHEVSNLIRRRQVYILVQTPENYEQAYRLARGLFEADQDNHVPSLLCITYALQNALTLPESERLTLEQIFETPRQAYEYMANYHVNRISSGYPNHGIVAALEKLETQLGIPAERSVLRLNSPIDENSG